MDEFLWELLESEAPDKFYVGRRESPAFLLFPRHHWACIGKGHSLYLAHVGLIQTFTSQKKALERLKEIIANANFAVKVYRQKSYGRDRGKRVIFAENAIERVDMTDAKGPCKVFNIKEWEEA